MLPKGLLVVDPHNQTFLLVPEKDLETTGYTLSVLQLQKDQWGPPATRLFTKTSRKHVGSLARIFRQSLPDSE
jgi:hypothetical protein